jgi:cytochrome oxidase Cu insertion factor (SCO1/SenC/PrrC family)
LIDPARPLPSIALPTPDGTATDPGFLRGKWTMLYVGDGLCDDRCRKALYLTRQSHIALNKDVDRVQRVFLVTGRCCDRAFLAQEHPDLVVALVEAAESATLLEPFPVYGGVLVADAGRIYLVDPLGNLLMSYSAAAPDKALLQDVKKLLRLSHIG